MSYQTQPTLIIVGNIGGTNVGSSLQTGASRLGFSVHVCDSCRAFGAPRWLARMNWHLLGHRPTHIGSFSREVLRACRRYSPRWLLTTGLAPVQGDALSEIGKLGVRRINYLTDDPWNPSFRSRWFFRSLKSYDVVFSARRSNLTDLRKGGCRAVEYLPFGFDGDLFYSDPSARVAEFDMIFVGGADRDRVPFVHALIHAGMRVALYGNYWDRFPETKSAAMGHASPDELRRATCSSKIALCLVRRANRDGHVMRSFEIPAIGGCMLTEDTEEHREIFGADGEAVVYFRSIPEMVEKARWLLAHEDERLRLAASAHKRIVGGRNTYQDRLEAMLA